MLYNKKPLPPVAVCVLFLMVATIETVSGQSISPADTFFSLAVTENSHNHTGARLLYLDFQQAPYSPVDQSKGEIQSRQAPVAGITLDGNAGEWDPTTFTTVNGLVQNNYPLSEFIDAVGTDISVGSAWDASNVYFVVQWEDAGHTASQRIKKWIFGDQGSGQTGWNQQVNVGATPGAPNASVVNATGHVLAGSESEDRVFFMFPVNDSEGAFKSSGAGCAMYCHTNLIQDDPYQPYTGDGVVAMHTNIAGDVADIWHWKSSRTEPSGVADDKHLVHAIGSASGRTSDSGSSAYSSNGLNTSGTPTSMHSSGLGYLGDILQQALAIPFAGSPSSGAEIPRYISKTPSGSRGDVATAATFDSVTNIWTVEFQRARDTGNADDHSFNGVAEAPPTQTLVTQPNASAGAGQYMSSCMMCHGLMGAGVDSNGAWLFPRVQRASGSLIKKAVNTVPAMSFLSGMSDQQIEDVAAYLQTLSTPSPQPPAVTTFGTSCGGTLNWAGVPKVGTTFTVFLNGAIPGITATLAIGFNNYTWGGFALPLDLGLFGATGCELLVSYDMPLPYPTNGFGTAAAPLNIPNVSSLAGFVVYGQWLHLGLSNPLGLEATNAFKAVIQP